MENSEKVRINITLNKKTVRILKRLGKGVYGRRANASGGIERLVQEYLAREAENRTVESE